MSVLATPVVSPLRHRPTLVLALALATWMAAAGAARAQPFHAYVLFTPGASGYIDVPASPDLNPTSAFTFEAWVKVQSTPSGCRSIAGKNDAAAWWIGYCPGATGQPVLRSWLKGAPFDGGVVPIGEWTHIAVAFDGSHRLHYIDGELVASLPETGPLSTSDADMRIGSDVNYAFDPSGTMDEVRLWSVARTQQQLRDFINVEITTPQTGLVGVWNFDEGWEDVVGGHGGALVGSGVLSAFLGTNPDCSPEASPTLLCLSTRFQVQVFFRTSATPGPVDGPATVVNRSSDSGVLWFFAPTNWELLLKVLDGCGVNGHYWVYSAATTDRFFRIEVYDGSGAQKIYFSYPGAPAPAITDSSAFATCP